MVLANIFNIENFSIYNTFIHVITLHHVSHIHHFWRQHSSLQWDFCTSTLSFHYTYDPSCNIRLSHQGMLNVHTNPLCRLKLKQNACSILWNNPVEQLCRINVHAPITCFPSFSINTQVYHESVAVMTSNTIFLLVLWPKVDNLNCGLIMVMCNNFSIYKKPAQVPIYRYSGYRWG